MAKIVPKPLSIDEFLELFDTPIRYTGYAGKYVRVNLTETGLEFVAGGGGSGSSNYDWIVFSEQFTGDGNQTVFTLTGNILVGTFASGAWQASGIKNLVPSHVTGTDNKPTYDSANFFTRHKVEVSSINVDGTVTLTYAPMNGVDFKIFYWYYPSEDDDIDNYYREEFVATMEADIPEIATNIKYDNSVSGLVAATVQAAIDELDSTLDAHEHAASDITSGNLNVARLPVSGNWSLTGDLNVNANTLVIDQDESRVGIGTDAPGGALGIGDGNTYITKDVSNNLSFTDANAGTLTLMELSCPPLIFLKSTGVSEGDIHLSDGSNWNTSKSLIKTIYLNTDSTNWDLYILQNDNGHAVNDANIPEVQLMGQGNGHENIFLELPYQDEDASKEVHLYWIDNSGSNTCDIIVTGYSLR